MATKNPSPPVPRHVRRGLKKQIDLAGQSGQVELITAAESSGKKVRVLGLFLTYSVEQTSQQFNSYNVSATTNLEKFLALKQVTVDELGFLETVTAGDALRINLSDATDIAGVIRYELFD